ncbi:MAG: hypothetical protein KatS3mg076_1867 [Candidatus Binatia bacterium]|nr:MAG: hypothetical protein KatS3mg076_1867 [Candidatus Binatia bacterium]
MLKKALLVLVVAILAVAGWAWWRAGHVELEKVRDHVYMVRGIGGNVAILDTPQGFVVVDTMTFVRQGRAIRKKLREIADRPVVAILNTHYHLDHTHGNPAFVPGTKVVSTKRTLEHLRTLDADYWAEPPASELLPNDTFETVHVLQLGGKTVRSAHLGRGHTDGDLVALFVEDRVLVAGDLFFHGHYPNIDLEAGGSVREWVATLDRVLELDFDAVIPGHGPPSDREGLRRFQEFLRSLWTQTEEVVRGGGTLEDAIAKVDLERFGLRPLWFAPYLNRKFVIRRAFEEASSQPQEKLAVPPGAAERRLEGAEHP